MPGSRKMEIQRIFIYPVKSLLPVEVTSAEITNEGLRFDRQYVVVQTPADAEEKVAEHLTIKKNFDFCLFKPQIDSSWSKLTIKHVLIPESSFTVPLTPSPLSLLNSKTYQVSIFGTTAIGVDMGDEPSAFFTRHLRKPARLLYIAGSGRREIPGAAYVPKDLRALSLHMGDGFQPQRIRFADAAPLLVTSTKSEENARSRLPKDYQSEDVIVRFRPNIHVNVQDQLPAYDEDHWKTLVIRSRSDRNRTVIVKCIFKCVRCLSLNVDMEKGGMIPRERQLYGLLASDRRVNEKFPHKPVFGQYAFAGPAGAILRVGDEVELIERDDGQPTGSPSSKPEVMEA